MLLRNTTESRREKKLLHLKSDYAFFHEFMSVFGIEYLIMFVEVVCLKIYSTFPFVRVKLCALFCIMSADKRNSHADGIIAVKW